MKKSLLQLKLEQLGIRKGESPQTYYMQAILFLLITTLLLIKPTVNSIFLSKLGAESLSKAYVATAVVAVLGHLVYNQLVNSLPLRRVMEGTTLFHMAVLLLLGFYLHNVHPSTLLIYSAYVFIALYGLLATSQFWLLCNLVYNVREAKRVFGLIGAGGIAGGIFGGYLTKVLSQWMESSQLLIIAAFLLLPVLLLYRKVWQHYSGVGGSKPEVHEKKKIPLKVSKGEPEQSKLLNTIALTTGISVVVAKLIDYQYNEYAARLIVDQEKLTGFFGLWLSNISLFSLIIQLFFTSKILKYLGVGNAMMLMPTGLLLGSILLLIFPELWAVVLIKVIDGSLKQSIDKSARELLYLPVPSEAKKNTKNYIDVVVDSLATGAAGLLLALFVNYLKLETTQISFVVIAAITVWLMVLVSLKKEYILAFKKIVIPKADEVEAPDIPQARKANSLRGTVEWIFEHSEEHSIAFTLEKLLEGKPYPRLVPQLQKLLNHEDARIRALAVENLYHQTTVNLSEEVVPLLEDPEPDVVVEAVRYLLRYDSEAIRQLALEQSTQWDGQQQLLALLGVAKAAGQNSKMKEKYQLEKRMEKAIYGLDDIADTALKNLMTGYVLEIIGIARLQAFYPFIRQHLKGHEPATLGKALKSAGLSGHEDFTEAIVKQLSNQDQGNTAMRALTSLGSKILPRLEVAALSEETALNNRVMLPEAIGAFANIRAMLSLLKIGEGGELPVNTMAIRQLCVLVQNGQQFVLPPRYAVRQARLACIRLKQIIGTGYTLQGMWKQLDEPPYPTQCRKELIKALVGRYGDYIDQIVALLELQYDGNDLKAVDQALKRGNEDMRLNALEFLDNVLDITLRPHLIPLIESAVFRRSDTKKAYEVLKLEERDEYHSLATLLAMDDPLLTRAVKKLIDSLHSPRLSTLIDPAQRDDETNIVAQLRATLLRFSPFSKKIQRG